MSVTEKIQKKVVMLPKKLQAEVLNFVEYLLMKAEYEATQKEDVEWTNFSLASAMRGMEDEEVEYSLDDAQEIYHPSVD